MSFFELRRERDNYPLEETDVLEIKKAVLAENFCLSPLKRVSFGKEDPRKGAVLLYYNSFIDRSFSFYLYETRG